MMKFQKFKNVQTMPFVSTPLERASFKNPRMGKLCWWLKHHLNVRFPKYENGHTMLVV